MDKTLSQSLSEFELAYPLQACRNLESVPVQIRQDGLFFTEPTYL